MSRRIILKNRLYIAVVFTLALAIGVLFYLLPSKQNQNNALAAFPNGGDPISANDFEGLRSRCGLTPGALSAAGLTDTDTGKVLSSLDLWATENWDALSTLDAEVAKERIATSRMRRSLRRGESTYTPSDLSAASARLQTAERGLTQTLVAAEDAIAASLSEAQAGTLATIHDNRGWRLAAELRVADLSEADWLALKRTTKMGADDILTDDQQVATRVNGRSDVITANANRAVRESGIQIAVIRYEANR